MADTERHGHLLRPLADKLATEIATASRNKQSPFATNNLLENTDGVLRPPSPRGGGGSEHPISVLSRDGSLLPSSYADARCIDAVVVSKAVRLVLPVVVVSRRPATPAQLIVLAVTTDNESRNWYSPDAAKLQGYTLEVGQTSVTVSSPTLQGVHYGTRTALQLMQSSRSSSRSRVNSSTGSTSGTTNATAGSSTGSGSAVTMATMPGCVVEDAPDLPVRGFYLDSRPSSGLNATFFRALATQMGWLHLNTLILHSDAFFGLSNSSRASVRNPP